MKRRFSRSLLVLMLAAAISIQPNVGITDATLSVVHATSTDKDTNDAGNAKEETDSKDSADDSTQASNESAHDITDGNTDVDWPSGPKENNLSSNSAILMDADSGLILYNKNMHDQHYPASITKIMTTLLAIENCSLDDVVTFTADEVTNLEYGASNIETQVGEKLTIDQCLYGIMLSSANEVCNGVADHVAGSISSFADMMNARAQELGCKNTHFSNPNGLHSDDHYTSAYDMALIGQAAIQNETFRQVAGSKVYYMDKTNKYGTRTLVNHHNMLYAYSTDKYLYDNCIGGKTGYTSMARSTLVTFAKRDGMTLICVVMQGDSSKVNPGKNIYTDTTSLLEYGFSNYEVHALANAGTESDDVTESPMFSYYDSIFDKNTSPLSTSNSSTLLLPNGADIEDATQSAQFLDTPSKDHVIGTVTYTYGQKTVGSTDVYFNPEALTYSLSDLSDITFTDSTFVAGTTKATTTQIRRIAIIVSLALVALLLLAVFYTQVIRGGKSGKDEYKPGRRR